MPWLGFLLREEIKMLVQEMDLESIMASETLREAFEDGRAKGIEQGKAQALRGRSWRGCARCCRLGRHWQLTFRDKIIPDQPGTSSASHCSDVLHALSATTTLRAPATNKPATIILFLGANPSDTTRLAIDREAREIDQRIRATEHRDAFSVVQAWAVRAVDLQERLLRYRPSIVHFSGHGSPAGELLLEDENSQAKPVTTAALKSLFRTLGRDIRCVVMNACFSELQARAIAEHVECVIGMTSAIGDRSAIAFAGAFYQALGFGENVQTAFELACGQINLTGLIGAGVPRLLVREGLRAQDIRFGGGEPRPHPDGSPNDDKTQRPERQPAQGWPYRMILESASLSPWKRRVLLAVAGFAIVGGCAYVTTETRRERPMRAESFSVPRITEPTAKESELPAPTIRRETTVPGSSTSKKGIGSNARQSRAPPSTPEQPACHAGVAQAADLPNTWRLECYCDDKWLKSSDLLSARNSSSAATARDQLLEKLGSGWSCP